MLMLLYCKQGPPGPPGEKGPNGDRGLQVKHESMPRFHRKFFLNFPNRINKQRALLIK